MVIGCIFSMFLIAGTTIVSANETFDLTNGKKVFSTTCFACHGHNGKGAVPGVPDMTKSESRLHGETQLLLKHVLEGYQSAGSPLAMPPKGGNPTLTDKEIQDAIGYMKDSFLPKKK